MEQVPIIGGPTTEMISINPKNIIGYSSNSDGYTELLYYSELNGGKPISLVLGITKEEFDAIVLASNTITILYADVINATTGNAIATSYNEIYIVSLKDLTTTIAGIPGVSVVELTYSMGSLGNKKVLINGTVDTLARGVPSYMAPQVNSDWNAVSGVAKILNKPRSMPASDVYPWAKAATKPSYNATEIGLGNVTNNAQWHSGNHPTTVSGYGITDIPTTLPASDVYPWAKATTKPTYTPTEVGAEPSLTKNTGFNKDFGSTSGTVLEGRTFGTAAAAATTDFIQNQNSSAQSANMWIDGLATVGDDGLNIGGYGTKYGAISVRKNLSGYFVGGYHGIEDNSSINISSGLIAYAAFAATPIINNDVTYDHFVGMQSQPSINSSAIVGRLDGFASHMNIGSTATVDNMSGLHVYDYSGGGGVTNNYGILLENIDNGTNNYSIYAKSGKMFLGQDDLELFYGNLQISGRDHYLFFPTCQGKIGDAEGILQGGSVFDLAISGYSGANLVLGTGDSHHVTIQNNGYVGIKTSTPSTLLSNTSLNPDDGLVGGQPDQLTWSINSVGPVAALYNTNNNAASNGLLVKTFHADTDNYIANFISGGGVNSGTSRLYIRGDGHIGAGYSTGTEIDNNKLAVNGTIYSSSTVDAAGYKLSGTSTFLDWARTGYAGTAGQYLKSQGTGTTPIWTTPPFAPLVSPTFTGTVTAPTIISTATITFKGYTVSTLPAGTIGMTAYVTDALAPSFLAIIVGGGAVTTPVFFNGTNWVGY